MAAQSGDRRYIFEEMPVPGALAHFMVPTVMSQLTALLLNPADPVPGERNHSGHGALP